jgi:hypothetical protein
MTTAHVETQPVEKAQPVPQVPVQIDGEPTREVPIVAVLGRPGLSRNGRQITNEWHPQLRDDRDADAFAAMRDRPITGAAYLMFESWIRRTPFNVTPADENRPAAVACAARLDAALHDMRHTFQDMICDASSMLVFGNAPCEMLWKECLGRRPPKQKDPVTGEEEELPTSKYNDRVWAWDGIMLRSQQSISGWEFNPKTDRITGCWQNPYTGGFKGAGKERFIPREKMVLWRTSAQLDNPKGRSMFRPAFDPDFFATKLRVIEAMKHERNALGVWLGRLPGTIMAAADGTPEATLRNKMLDFLAGIRADDRIAMTLPPKTDGYDVENVAANMDTGPMRETIRGHDHDTAIAMMAEVFFLGLSRYGAEGVQKGKMSLIGHAITAWVDVICDTFNADAAIKFAEYNGWDPDDAAGLTHGKVIEPTLEELMGLAKTLSGGAVDPALENFMRMLAGAPPRDMASLDVG